MKHYIQHIVDVAGLKNRSELARQLGVTRSMISHIEAGRRDITPEMARDIEKLTGGKVTRVQLRPDIFA